MSVIPCPQCGSPFPPNARFCGQCGATFATPDPNAPAAPRRVPITVDEATSDKATALQPNVGIRTVIGFAAVRPSEVEAAKAAKAAKAANPLRVGHPTMIGHAATPALAPRALGQTLFDPAPYGQTASHDSEREAAATSQRPTPVVPPPTPSMLGQTMIGPQTEGQVREEQQDDVTRRVDTVVVDPVMPAPHRPALGQASDKHTIVGMPAVSVPTPSTSPTPPPSAAQAFPPALKTMMGVAMPGIAPSQGSRAPEPPSANASPAAVDRAGTLLGVAAPGIAPVNPGPARASAHPTVPGHAPPPVVPAPAPLVEEPLPEPLPMQRRKGVPAIVVVAIVFVLVGLVGGVAALLIFNSGAPLTAQPQLDETGKESLKIRCESCPDGTVVSLGASSAQVRAASALLPLPAPLSIGDNDLAMMVDRPAGGRDETVKVHVPVAYRVKVDLSTLGADPPAVTVRVEALPGTDVTVDGKPVALDPNGKASHPIDVTADVAGPSRAQKAIDRKIPFTIKSKRGASEDGQLTVRAVVLPLQIDAPGLELFTDRANAAISGLTKIGAALTVDGQSVPVDATGRFGIRVELPANSEKTLTIVASGPPMAPRTVRAKVTRVASLESAAKTLDAKTPLGFDAFGSDPAANVGKLVAIDGEIIQINATQGYTVMMVEERKSCMAKTACVVRIVHGEEIKATPGTNVRAYGRLEGTVSAGGKTIPDIEGALVMTRSGTPR